MSSLKTIPPPALSDVLREQLEALLVHAEKKHDPCLDCGRLDAVAQILMVPFEQRLTKKATA